MGPTPPCCKRGSVPKSRLEKETKTHGKEDPLKHLAVVSWLFRDIEPKLVFSIVVLRKIEYDGGRLEDREALRSGRGRSVPVHQDGDSAVRI